MESDEQVLMDKLIHAHVRIKYGQTNPIPAFECTITVIHVYAYTL